VFIFVRNHNDVKQLKMYIMCKAYSSLYRGGF